MRHRYVRQTTGKSASPVLFDALSCTSNAFVGQKARMRTAAAPIFAAQVCARLIWFVVQGDSAACCDGLRCTSAPVGTDAPVSASSSGRLVANLLSIAHSCFPHIHFTNHLLCCCVCLRLFAPQMNALHEPWADGALSEDLSWGAAPALAQSSEALADTAASGGAAAAMPAGLAALAPGQELDLGLSYRGPKVRLLLLCYGLCFGCVMHAAQKRWQTQQRQAAAAAAAVAAGLVR